MNKDPEYWFDLARRCKQGDETAILEMKRIVPKSMMDELLDMAARHGDNPLTTADKKRAVVWGIRLAMGGFEPTAEQIREVIKFQLLPPCNEKFSLDELLALKEMLEIE